ncbi:MAG TPA: hypothetical protein VL688_02220 [Verrucomicrobiae bacterium]|jgi:outer membrane lipoprotein-sorting protein|nr:hypothetical protein [Verrucomicrobiae bacterium]
MKSAKLILALAIVSCVLGPRMAAAFTGSYEETISVGDKPVAHFRVYSKDKKVRTEFLMEGQSEIIVRNDKGTFRYSSEQKAALKLPPVEDQPTLLDHLDDYTGFLAKNNAVKKNTETMNGVQTDLYEFVDPMTQKNARAWVWQEKGFPVRIEIEAPEGLLRVDLEKIQIGGDVADSLFEIPADTRIIDVNEMYKNAAAQAGAQGAPEGTPGTPAEAPAVDAGKAPEGAQAPAPEAPAPAPSQS